MTEPTAPHASRWRDVKAKAQATDPAWDAPDRQARRAQLREQMLASVSGAKLAEIRKQLGLTQTQLAEATGLSQARISQIENGTATSPSSSSGPTAPSPPYTLKSVKHS